MAFVFPAEINLQAVVAPLRGASFFLGGLPVVATPSG